MKDLILLVADKAQKALLEALLERIPRVEGWPTAPSYDCIVYPNRDAGVRQDAAEFLRNDQANYRHALVLFDLEGCGVEENITANEIAAGVEQELSISGWPEDRCATVVLVPEIESWVWVGETHIQEVIGWRENLSVYEWLRHQTTFLPDEAATKPIRSKEALLAVLQHIRQPYSSALFGRIAARASYRRCHDPAFLKLLTHLRQWFNPNQ